MLSDRPPNRLVSFHKRLNPKLWRAKSLRPEVRLKLFHDAVAFYRFLDVPHLRVSDVILTGSNAAFNYTRESDIDVHLLVDFSRTVCPELAGNLFLTKKALWGKTYDVSIRGHAVEMYVEDTAEPVKANGVYSILRNKWIKQPEPVPPHEDDFALQAKVNAYAEEIDALLDEQPMIFDINALLEKLHILRQNGLQNGGEFSNENLTYKVLRNLGYLQKLYDARVEIRDRELSL